MKKIKYIALALVLCLGLIGGAYAWWTDTLEISGTVATGDMDVKITNVLVQNWNRDHHVPYTSAEASVSDDGKSASFDISGLYPTPGKDAHQRIRIYIENDSSIPVKLDNLEFSSGGSEIIWEHLKGEVTARVFDDKMNRQSIQTSDEFNFKAGIEDAFEELLSEVVLYPGWSVRFGADDEPENSVVLWLDGNDVGNETQDENIDFTLTFNWIQWNAQ